MKKERYVKICPKCGSTDIITSTGRYFIGGAEVYRDNCKDCGYEGVIPEIKKSEIEKFKKELKRIK